MVLVFERNHYCMPYAASVLCTLLLYYEYAFVTMEIIMINEHDECIHRKMHIHRNYIVSLLNFWIWSVACMMFVPVQTLQSFSCASTCLPMRKSMLTCLRAYSPNVVGPFRRELKRWERNSSKWEIQFAHFPRIPIEFNGVLSSTCLAQMPPWCDTWHTIYGQRNIYHIKEKYLFGIYVRRYTTQ